MSLLPRRPPEFSGRNDKDVHFWTSIVERSLRTVQGEPSTQLTYVVLSLRGVAFEWYSQYETCTGCPGNWTTLRQAMLEHFGSSVRAEKARAALLQMTQGKMTVLQYANAFESYLAQLEDYDESFFLTKFIFGLCPAIFTEVFVQHPTILLEAKRIAESLELTQSVVKMHQKSVKEKTTKAARHRGTQKRRSSRLYQSVQDRVQRKACRDRQNRYQTQTTTD